MNKQINLFEISSTEPLHDQNHNPLLIPQPGRLKPIIHVSFSGGLTSAYLTKWVYENYADSHEIIVTFANTGIEHEKTLEFVRNCDEQLGFKTVWLEAVVHPEKGIGTSHKIVNFETADRKGACFESVVAKYGIPNIVYKHCTRELKVKVMNSYLSSLGIKPQSVPTLIGIRADEAKRMSGTAQAENLYYPLVSLNPVDKAFVKHYWDETMPFTLGLEEHDGNCIGCFEKSFDKIVKQCASNPNALEFHIRMESQYGHVGNREGHPNRVFFRRNTSALEVSKLKLEDVIAREKEREEKRLLAAKLKAEKAQRKLEREAKKEKINDVA